MPPRKRNTALQCSYAEAGRRCRRNGTGRPAFCRIHLIAINDAARSAGVGPVGRGATRRTVEDVVNRFASGKKVSAGEAVAAAAEVLGAIFGHMPPPGPGRPGGNVGDHRVPHWFRGAQAGQQRQAPPDPRDQHQADLRKARQVLEIPPGIVLSADDIKKRHRELARKHHPDMGGPYDPATLAARTARMGAINAAAETLMAELG